MKLLKQGLLIFAAVPLFMSSLAVHAQDTEHGRVRNLIDSNSNVSVNHQQNANTDKDSGQMNEGTDDQSDISIDKLIEQVKEFEKAGEFKSHSVAQALQIHLTAVNHYAKQGKVKKVEKHMKGFKALLDKQFKNKKISKKAYNALQADADDLISKYAVTQPVFSYKNAIRESVYVETNLDTDKDGKSDRIAVDIIRPRETGKRNKVPVIMDASPYYGSLGRGNESELKQWNREGVPTKFPLYYDNYFVPRGYAVVLADMVGTDRSDGCPVTGGYADVESMKAVIDWLNGRAKAETADGKEVTADWTNGKVGMIGKSYDGTLANGVAATGVNGLKTIVPISAISSWYDYYRYAGIPYYRGGPAGLASIVANRDNRIKCQPVFKQMTIDSDDDTGDYNKFWDERNYYKNADNVKASVFAIHGLNDYNVKTNHFSQWWKEMSANHVPRKVWLSRTGHVDPFDFRRAKWVDTLHRWFDHWLKDIDNGIMDQPRVDVQRRDLSWETESNWPAEKTKPVQINFGPSSENTPGTLTTGSVEGKPTQSFTDDPRQSETQMVTDQLTKKDHRLVFLSPELKHSVRISGTPKVNLQAKVNKTDTNFTALLVDYGSGVHVDEGIKTLSGEDCWGDATSTDNACYRQTEMTTHTDPYEIVTRSWMDAENWQSLTKSNPLVPNKDYGFHWNILPEDYVFDKGHRIGIVIAASDRSWTIPEQNQATIETILGQSNISLPIVGGQEAIDF